VFGRAALGWYMPDPGRATRMWGNITRGILGLGIGRRLIGTSYRPKIERRRGRAIAPFKRAGAGMARRTLNRSGGGDGPSHLVAAGGADDSRFGAPDANNSADGPIVVHDGRAVERVPANTKLAVRIHLADLLGKEGRVAAMGEGGGGNTKLAFSLHLVDVQGC
jgi:hypothetical protein